MKPEEVFFLSNGRVAFEHAWIVLKQSIASPTGQDTRQATLGEFHPDFSSPFGPVTDYHGTTAGPASIIQSQGLQPKLPYEAQMNQEQTAAKLQGKEPKDWYPEGVYADGSRGRGEEYARWRSQDRNEAPAMFGIRGGGLKTEHHDKIPFFSNAIPRERLVPIPLNQKTP